ncbi:hypothetical protein GCM10010401_22910 [Rarobacter faecitabidus]
MARGAVTGNRLPIATAANTAIAGALGLIDDLAEADPNAAKGLRGHLGALRRGTLTTGAAKLIGISLSSAATAAIIARARRRTRGSAAAAIVVDTVLIAGMTNLVNLFDLRPGRALKVGALLALPLGAEAFPLAGAGGAVASEDLRGGSMAGDAGANALGAAIGCTWAMAMPLPVRAAAAVGVTALTVASERISFSRVIAGTPILDRIDRLGTARVAPIASHD